MKTVCLDLHDGSVLGNSWDDLLRIKDHYPEFKVSLFWVPFDYYFESSQLRLRRDEFLDKIKANLDWIQLIPHGIMHLEREFEKVSYYEMRDLMIPAIDEAFKKDNLPYEKGFCAPQWLWNEGVVRALNEAGWWGAVDRNQPEMLRTKKYYQYSHSIDEPFWHSTNDTLKLHGHMTLPSPNALENCVLNIFKLEPDVKWQYVTNILEDYDQKPRN